MSHSDERRAVRETVPPRTISVEEVARRKAYLRITPEDEARVRDAGTLLARHTDEIVDGFYAHLLAHPHTRTILERPGLLERLGRLQRDYFARLTAGVYDQAYFQDRLAVGYAHERIGLAPEWYLGAFHCYQRIVFDILARELGAHTQRHRDTLHSLTKLLYLDMGLAMDAYFEASQHRLQETILREKRAEATARAKDEFLARMSHELRTPLNSVIGFSSILLRGTTGFHGDSLVYLQRIRDNGTLLLQLVEQVLDQTRIETGKVELERTEVRLEALVTEIFTQLEELREQNGVTLSLQMPAEAGPVSTDRRRLGQVIRNLVHNGIKFAPGGQVVVRVVVDEASRPIRVHVSDTGIGIPRERWEEVFEPFVQLENGTSRRHGGLGLGLSIARSMAALLGYRLELASESGRGTDFTVHLHPASAPPGSDPPG